MTQATVEHLFAGLRPIRKHRRVTVRETAEALGMWPTSYVRLENGTRPPYLHHAAKLATVFGVQITDLMAYHDEDGAYRVCVQRDSQRGTPWTWSTAQTQLGQPNSTAPSAPPPPPTAAENIDTVVFAGADDPELEQLRAQFAAWEADGVVTE